MKYVSFKTPCPILKFETKSVFHKKPQIQRYPSILSFEGDEIFSFHKTDWTNPKFFSNPFSLAFQSKICEFMEPSV